MKALLCIDPYENKAKDLLPAVQTLRHLGFQSRRSLAVENVFVSSPLSLHLRLTLLDHGTRLRTDDSLRKLRTLAQKIWGSRSSSSHVLSEKSRSTKQSAVRLEKYCEAQSIRLLTVLKSPKGGLRRGLLGSFAESLMDISRRSLLIVPPDIRIRSQWKRVLFPTDFGKEDLEIFRNIANWAKNRKIELCLFHVPDPLLVFPKELKNPEVRNAVAQAQDALERSGQSFLKAAPKGLRLHIKISEDATDIPDQILKEARQQKIDLIIMSSKLGRWEKIFLGSITKTVVRHSSWPVLVARHLDFLK